MDLQFEKWQGCRNDFVVLRITDADGDIVLNSLRRQAPRLCDRHAGVGADGLLVLWTRVKDEVMPHRLSIINSDGSIAQNCGNGLRCAAASILRAYRKKAGPHASLEMLDLPVESQTKICRFLNPHQVDPLIAVEMGVPILNEHLSWWHDAQADVKAAVAQLDRQRNVQDLAACDIGNRHLIITMEDASRDVVRTLGPALQVSRHWDGINVHLIRSSPVTEKDQALAKNALGQKISEIFQAFVWERGAGETMACGSGAAAIGASALASGLLSRHAWIGVDMPGGRLYVKQEHEDDPVTLAGPASFIFHGTLHL